MKKLMVLLCCCIAFTSSTLFAKAWPAGRPKLVVLIMIDQFRADYLARFDSKFGKEGFRPLMNQGAYFPYGEYDILHSMTGPGHATVLTGAYPYQMGIPLNDWYDQDKKAPVYCVEDAEFGRSPKNLVGTTVGDELKNSGQKSQVVSIALKDRAAILMGGHRADTVLWFGEQARQWTSSDYYLKAKGLPAWLQKLNSEKLFATCDLSTPCGTEVTSKVVEAAIREMKLGQTNGIDLLSVSFSSHDYAGHKHGPNAPEMEAMTLAEDRAIASLRKTVAANVPGGYKNVVFVLSGDHGVAPTPEFLKDSGIESGNIDESALAKQLETSITKMCGSPKSGKWLPSVIDFNFFLNESAIKDSKCDLAKVEAQVKEELLKDSRFAQVFTQSDYEARKLPPGQFGRQADKTYYLGRSGHIVAIQKPFYINASKNNANHMTGYTYDRTVPILFSGFGIQPGLYADKAEVVDIAPTLSFLMGIVPPALSEGHVLKSALRLK